MTQKQYMLKIRENPMLYYIGLKFFHNIDIIGRYNI